MRGPIKPSNSSNQNRPCNCKRMHPEDRIARGWTIKVIIIYIFWYEQQAVRLSTLTRNLPNLYFFALTFLSEDKMTKLCTNESLVYVSIFWNVVVEISSCFLLTVVSILASDQTFEIFGRYSVEFYRISKKQTWWYLYGYYHKNSGFFGFSSPFDKI